jgi:hypothetical protein
MTSDKGVVERLTKAQRGHLTSLADRRPVAGNDDGWVNVSDVPRATLRVLDRLGLIEPSTRNVHAGKCLHRLTDKGRAALSPSTNGAEK